MDNVIGTCFVQMRADNLVDPTIYLTRPQENELYTVYEFHDPFTAKYFIKLNVGESVEITVKVRAA